MSALGQKRKSHFDAAERAPSTASLADILEGLRDVRFTPKSRHPPTQLECPLCAKSRLMHCNKHRGIQSTVSQQSWHLRKADEFDGLENSRDAIEE
jgi:hypothetical protein